MQTLHILGAMSTSESMFCVAKTAVGACCLFSRICRVHCAARTDGRRFSLSGPNGFIVCANIFTIQSYFSAFLYTEWTLRTHKRAVSEASVTTQPQKAVSHESAHFAAMKSCVCVFLGEGGGMVGAHKSFICLIVCVCVL